MSIEADVKTALSTLDATVYAVLAPFEASPPYVVYRRISTLNHASIGGPATLDQARIQINCYGGNYPAAKALAEQAKTAIHDAFGPRAVRIHESDESDDGDHWVWMDFSIWKKS